MFVHFFERKFSYYQLGVCSHCKKGSMIFDELISLIPSEYGIIEQHLRSSLREAANHYRFEIKHMVRQDELFHPMPLEYNILSHTEDYLNFEFQLMKLFVVRGMKDKANLLVNLKKATQIMKLLRLKFLASNPLHGQVEESFRPFISDWSFLFTRSKEEYVWSNSIINASLESNRFQHKQMALCANRAWSQRSWCCSWKKWCQRVRFPLGICWTD